MFTILSAVAENERDNIRQRVREAKQHRAAQQLYNGGRRPFGFDIVGEGKQRALVPNATEQEALQRARSMRQAGATFREISATLAERGIRKLDPKTLQRMLNREGA